MRMGSKGQQESSLTAETGAGEAIDLISADAAIVAGGGRALINVCFTFCACVSCRDRKSTLSGAHWYIASDTFVLVEIHNFVLKFSINPYNFLIPILRVSPSISHPTSHEICYVTQEICLASKIVVFRPV